MAPLNPSGLLIKKKKHKQTQQQKPRNDCTPFWNHYNPTGRLWREPRDLGAQTGGSNNFLFMAPVKRSLLVMNPKHEESLCILQIIQLWGLKNCVKSSATWQSW